MSLASRFTPSGLSESRVRNALPMASPSSAGRPMSSPFQNGIRAACPGAGDTRTRSGVISSMRHDVAPKTNTSPIRDSYTISSSSSPTREPRPPPVKKTPYRPRSGIVPAFCTATRWASGRALNRSFNRSHTSFGRSPENSVDGYRPDNMSNTARNAWSLRREKGAAR